MYPFIITDTVAAYLPSVKSTKLLDVPFPASVSRTTANWILFALAPVLFISEKLKLPDSVLGDDVAFGNPANEIV